MGIMHQIGKAIYNSDHGLRPDTTVALTPGGANKARQMDGRGDEFLVLQSLHENGPQTISSIAEDTHLGIPRVRAACWKLRGSVVKTRSGGDDLGD